ncbi:oxygen-independent coproporphyrinogen III oxidase [Dyella sp. A6]|uniref:oxygen-independent coproporphyrinogen III oxidase n=1 Tax=Dyella aluminiiresistens TaxID=3069105 RepID=UPI002E76128C|nr:oxygen-independent coproporphyrinogen III oxidase [Dyella sp. A6]
MNAVLHAPVFDRELIARYDGRGPRYTSYPTALQFRDDFGEADLKAAVAASDAADSERPLSLYVHVPFCRSPCFYCGCNRVISRDPTRADHYLQWLFREVEQVARLFGAGHRVRQVRQVHLGGGTPNFLDIPRMQSLMDALARHFRFDEVEQREFGIEVDPRFADGDYVRALAAMGFNRLSLGIQDFDPAVQRAVNREHGVEPTRVLVDEARAAGFRSINMDLIYGLPLQTPVAFARTLDEVIAIGPDRIAVYGYAHLPSLFKAQRQIKTEELPDAATRLELFGRALTGLQAAGYVYIGMDHFARSDDELAQAQRAGTLQRNFQGYSTHGDCDIVGLGVSAISRIGDSYSQNARDLAAYEGLLDGGHLPVVRGLLLDRDDLIRRELIGELMCHGAIDVQAFGRRHGLVFGDYFADSLARLQSFVDDGLVVGDMRRLQVTSRGRLLLRNIAMCFDRYAGAQADAARYSKTI